jgi:ribonuclease HII
VVAAAVVLNPDVRIAGVGDSKKISPVKRTELAQVIQAEAISWAVASASVEEIDALNILQASLLAMRRAVARLDCESALVRVDGNRAPNLTGVHAGPVELLVRGDALCPAIGAASILAKVARDLIMDQLHRDFPVYGFNRHRGYPTREHREILHRVGPSDAHRRSFRPVREAMAEQKRSGRAIAGAAL